MPLKIRKKFRIRSKPKRPKRSTITHRHDVYDGMTLWEINDAEIPDSAEFSFDRYDDFHPVELVWTAYETDEDYQAKLKAYKNRLDNYERWYKENQEDIENEIALRETEAAERVEKDKEKALKRAEKEYKEAKRKIDKLKK